MTIKEALAESRTRLAEKGIETPFLDACLLLGHTLGISKESLIASYPDIITESQARQFQELIERRLSGIPVSYLRNVKEFYGREFFVDPRVLVPRPDTETLVDTVLDLLDSHPSLTRIHDTCTGTGCIALTVKLERPQVDISASDISPEAGEVFIENCRRLGADIPFYLSDLLSSVPGRLDIITANPPYLADDEYREMEKNNWPEPKAALAAGERGLAVLDRLIKESVESLSPNGYLVCEAAPPQFPELKLLMEGAGFNEIRIVSDLAGRSRVILGRL